MPRDLADNTQFEKKDDLCADGGKKFLGQRYWYKQDPTFMLLFDKNGIIAGMQNSMLKSKYTPPAQLQKYYGDDGDYWTLTAYVVDPSIICSQGRSKADLASQGTGTGLWLQYGPDPIQDSIKLPDSEEEMKKTLWGNGKCLKSMGMHYWYNQSLGSNCDDLLPNCILYNGGKLNAFCFSTAANLAPIDPLADPNRWDWPSPTALILRTVMDPVPTCFFTNPKYWVQGTVHVYFTDDAQHQDNC